MPVKYSLPSPILTPLSDGLHLPPLESGQALWPPDGDCLQEWGSVASGLGQERGSFHLVPPVEPSSFPEAAVLEGGHGHLLAWTSRPVDTCVWNLVRQWGSVPSCCVRHVHRTIRSLTTSFIQPRILQCLLFVKVFSQMYFEIPASFGFSRQAIWCLYGDLLSPSVDSIYLLFLFLQWNMIFVLSGTAQIDWRASNQVRSGLAPNFRNKTEQPPK